MLADIRYWENKAKEGKFAIPHFNVWNAEMLMGVMDAAEEAKAPVIISFGTGFVGNTSFEDFEWALNEVMESIGFYGFSYDGPEVDEETTQNKSVLQYRRTKFKGE